MIERILCAAVYVDDGKNHQRRSYNYPKTGLVFTGWRHPDCFTTMNAWADMLTEDQRIAIDAVQKYQLFGKNQGFLTSTGRYVDRQEGYQIARAAGQLLKPYTDDTRDLFSEDVY